ncbi:MAG TPA: hypothetical protein VK425_04745, partial [Acidimicrobiales bacterium]|nr:hypothetical protein [Acidimicrobiales bacterium]
PAQTADMSLRRDAEAVVTLASVDPSIGADHLPFWANGSVVVVRAGKASATRLAGTVQLLRGAGLAPATAMLVGADREDESVGAVEEPVR